MAVMNSALERYYIIELNFKHISIKSKILSFLKKNKGKEFKFNTLLNVLQLDRTKRKVLRNELEKLTSQGQIIKTGKYYSIKSNPYAVNSKSSNNKSSKHSVNSDEKFLTYEKPLLKFITGRFEGDKNEGIVVPDSKIIKKDVYVTGENISGAKFGDKVLCKLVNYKDQNKERAELYGKIEEVIGTAGELTTEIQAVFGKYNLNEDFPEKVIKETERLSIEYDLNNRLDLREKKCFTIDPSDAKDFDDALSIEKLNTGNYLVGVHIADVSHYVKENTPLDIEALKRGTSVYLVDNVVPMLPEVLSNNICSLRPDEDRLTYSVMIEITEGAEVKGFEIKKSIINSKKRFTYQEAQDVIDKKKGPLKKEVLQLYKISKNLTSKRMKEGSLNFETKEVKFAFTKKGKVKDIVVKERLDSMRLIEEFMLLANKCVTQYITRRQKEEKRELPFIYRVHDLPDQQKLKDLSEFIIQFGYKIKLKPPVPDKESLKKLLEEINGKPEEYVINDLLIRAMAKAIYTDKNIGHYGLGFEDYTHFTSPIRRYPDLLVHRILHEYITEEGNLQSRINYYKKTLPEICKHCSLQEQNAVSAEREVIKIRQIEYINRHPNKIFNGIISGLIERGMFVEINDILVEGMVRYKDIEDDYYEYDQKNHCAIGRRTKKVYHAGQNVKVRILKTNMENKKIDFELID